MKKLNGQFRNQNKTTDVLSFPSGEQPQGCVYAGKKNAAAFKGFLGDIAISLPVARRTARRLGTGAQTEAKHYLVHGLLHVLGHTHASEADARKMAMWEKRLLGQRGMLQRL